MKDLSAKKALIPALSLGLICLIITLLLTITNAVTNPVISRMEEDKAETTRKAVLPEAYGFRKVEGLENSFEGLDENGNTAGYVFTTSVKGYGGEILVMIGISSDSEVEGVVLLSQSETPGLGANVAKEEFRDQFKREIPEGGFTVVKGEPSDGEIEAITGATISSKAVADAVNIALDRFRDIQNSGVSSR